MTEMTETRFDTIVVGAGSSGAVLAARLSEDPQRRVLLIEAGPFYRTTEEFPREMRYAGVMRAAAPGHPATWKFATSLTPESQFLLPRGKVAGGGSAVNGALFNWGLREDFDAWAATAADDRWGPDAIFSAYRRLERDLDFPNDRHGTTGPITVTRVPRRSWSNVATGFVAACEAKGHRYDADVNGADSIGVGPIPVNVVNGVRQNTAITYLAEAADRPNLTIAPSTTVLKVLFEGRSARGVVASGPEGFVSYTGEEVVLSAGSIKSAQLLMLSGIGPGGELRAHGIDVLQESPAVGTGFTDHGLVRVWYRSKGASRVSPESGASYQVALNYTSGIGAHVNDMQLLPSAISMNRQLLHGTSLAQRARILQRSVSSVPFGKLMEHVRRGWDHNLYVLLMTGESRGTIRLASGDPESAPVISHNYLSEEADRIRLREGVKLATEVLASPSFAEAGVSAVRPLTAGLESDEEIDQYVRTYVGTAQHLSSSCRMGASHTEHSVVDPECRVFGVAGLRVVDTSVMPAVVRRGPNATAMAIGEQVADMMR